MELQYWRDLRTVNPETLSGAEYFEFCQSALVQYRLSLSHLNKPPTGADIAAAKEFRRNIKSAVPSMLLPVNADFGEDDMYDKDMGYFGYAGTGGHPLLYVNEQKLSPEQYFTICMTAVSDDSDRNKPGCHFAGHALELVKEAALNHEQYFSICMAAVKASPSEVGALRYVKDSILTEKQYQEIRQTAIGDTVVYFNRGNASGT